MHACPPFSSHSAKEDRRSNSATLIDIKRRVVDFFRLKSVFLRTGSLLGFLILLCPPMVAVAETSQSNAVPRVVAAPAGDFAAALREITGEPWAMEQAWRATPESGLRPGLVRFGWQPDSLWILADLTDEHVDSRSTDHNQDMWALGDVFEIFVARGGSPQYLELHITPNNHRLHLRLTGSDVAKLRENTKKVADFHADPDAFQSWVRRSPEGSGWQVLARIPAAIFADGTDFAAGQEFDLSFSRYDAGPQGTPDILSSTSTHRKINFHRRHEWRRAALQP